MNPTKNNTDTEFLHGPSPILGPDGQPLPRRKELLEELAAPSLTGVRAYWQQSVSSGLTPERLAAMLKSALDGDHRDYLRLAEDMEERDPHYASVLGTRKRALAGIKPIVNAASQKRTDQKIADAVEELLDDPQIPDLVADMLDALGKGYSVIEIIWKEYNGQWWPARYEHRNPAFFTFDHISRTDIRLATDGGGDGVALPPAKFIRHLPRLKTGIPVRGGLARLAAWSFCFKQFSLMNWATFLDVYGMPLRVGKYHTGATADERRALLRAVQQIASDAAAIIPESMMIEFIETKGFADKPFENIARYLDEQIAKAIVGQTMTSDSGGSLAQAKVHNEVRLDILEFDAQQAGKTLNRDLIAWFVALNFGQSVIAPRVEFPVPKPEDVKALSDALGKLVPLGLKVKQDEIRDKLGLSAPDETDEVLAPPAAREPAPQGKPGDQDDDAPALDGDPDQQPESGKAANRALHIRCRCPSCIALNAQGEPVRDQLETDLEEIAAAGAEDWEPQIKPALDALMRAAYASSSYEEFAQKLDELMRDLPMDEMEKQVFIAQMKARGLAS